MMYESVILVCDITGCEKLEEYIVLVTILVCVCDMGGCQLLHRFL